MIRSERSADSARRFSELRRPKRRGRPAIRPAPDPVDPDPPLSAVALDVAKSEGISMRAAAARFGIGHQALSQRRRREDGLPEPRSGRDRITELKEQIETLRRRLARAEERLAALERHEPDLEQTVQERVLRFLDLHHAAFSPREIMVAVQGSEPAVRAALTRLRNLGAAIRWRYSEWMATSWGKQ